MVALEHQMDISRILLINFKGYIFERYYRNLYTTDVVLFSKPLLFNNSVWSFHRII